MSARRRLRVTVLAPDLAGGGLTRAYWIAQVLLHLGHAAEIIGPRLRERTVYPPPPPGLRVVPVPGGSLPALAATLLPRIRGDVLYAVKPRPASYGAALAARLLRRRPLLLDIDDDEPALHEGPHRFRPRSLLDPHDRFLIERLASIASRADGVTVNTRFLQRRYGGRYLPSGKDTRLFDPARHDPAECRRRLGLQGLRVVLFPGTPAEHKGVEDALAALDLLDRRDLRLVIAGGRRTAYAEAMATRPRTIVLPRRGIGEMPQVLAAAHVVVVPQRDTPVARAQCPMKLFDAMAMARPIVATPVGEIPEVLGDTGVLVEPSRPDRLAEAIARVLDEPDEAAARGARARERCRERYGLDATAERMRAVLAAVGCS